MNYRSFADLNTTIINNLHTLPRDIQLIAGIPRSGLLAANLLALHMHLPLTEVDSFLSGSIFPAGSRLNTETASFAEISNVLIVDDSLASGKSLQTVRNKLKDVFPEKNIQYATIYVNPGKENEVDFFFETCPQPRIFEWNLMNHPYITNACVDIDGVLCKDPTRYENDDGPRYTEFLLNATPLLPCREIIGHLVTNRLEKYRDLTEEWLHKHNIRYNELIMRDFPNQQARREANDYGTFKGKIYKNLSGSRLFIESSKSQSVDIVNLSGKPVFCVDSRELITPGILPVSQRRGRNLLKKSFRKLFG